MMWRRYGGVLVAVAALAIFLYLFADTQHWSTRARLFSQVIVGPAMLLAFVQVVREARRTRAGLLTAGPAEAAVTPSSALWTGLFFVAVVVAGLVPTIPLFAVAYLRIEGKLPWVAAVLYALAATLFVWVVFGSLLHIPLPKGVIGFSIP